MVIYGDESHGKKSNITLNKQTETYTTHEFFN